MLMLAISKSIEGTRSIPATCEIFSRTAGDFQASYVKGARLGWLVNVVYFVTMPSHDRVILTLDPCRAPCSC